MTFCEKLLDTQICRYSYITCILLNAFITHLAFKNRDTDSPGIQYKKHTPPMNRIHFIQDSLWD